MNRKVLLKVSTLSLIVLLSLGCDKAGNTPQGNLEDNNTVSAKATIDREETTAPAPDAEESQEPLAFSGKVYFPSKAYVADGDDSQKYIAGDLLPDYLPKEDTLGDLVLAILEEGPQAPQITGDSLQDATNAVPKDSILGVEIKGGLATVNVSKDKLAGGGELDEELFLGQIVKTLTSFKEIKGVHFLVDGQEAESLLGHYDLSQVFTDFE